MCQFSKAVTTLSRILCSAKFRLLWSTRDMYEIWKVEESCRHIYFMFGGLVQGMRWCCCSDMLSLAFSHGSSWACTLVLSQILLQFLPLLGQASTWWYIKVSPSPAGYSIIETEGLNVVRDQHGPNLLCVGLTHSYKSQF